MAEKDRPQTNRRIYPALVTFAFIGIAYLLKWLLPLVEVSQPLRNTGFGLVVVGFFFGMAALMEFRKARTTSNPHGTTTKIVTTGIYRFTRNPIYLGFLFMVIGLPLNGNTYWGLILAPLFVIGMNQLVIVREEAYLAEKFPKEYGAYQSQTRRWL